VRFCEAHYYYYPHVKDRLSELGIPYLLIETEHEPMFVPDIESRIHAFVEMIRNIKA
jgi:benzoyl-CoA reductase/2-hydroxyglutaryl-CoA dehydratase subunit BcrC/BadD/HgdB